jgi:hypothetical protein
MKAEDEEEFDVTIPVKKKIVPETPVPPYLPRELSDTCTLQGKGTTCNFHAFTKLILQNVCHLLLNLVLTPSERAQYKRCLTDHPLNTDKTRYEYTKEECSGNGYFKIAFFYYFYDFLNDNDIDTKDLSKSKYDIKSLIEAMPQDDEKEQELKHSLLGSIEGSGLKWKQVQIDVNVTMIKIIINHIIKPILNLNLYIRMSLIRGKGKHSVLLVGLDEAKKKYLIKNSWGDELDTIPFGVSIDLRSHEYTLDKLHLLLPMPMDYPEPNPSYALEHLDMQALIQWIHQYTTDAPGFLSPTFLSDRMGAGGTKKMRRKTRNRKMKRTYRGLRKHVSRL